MKVDFRKFLCFDVFMYIYENYVRRIFCNFWLLRFLKVSCVVLIIDIYIYTFHFVKYCKVFSLHVKFYTFLEWCLVEGSCFVMHLWSKSVVFRLFAFMIGGYLKYSWILYHCSE